jgi:hypothetical protein
MLLAAVLHNECKYMWDIKLKYKTWVLNLARFAKHFIVLFNLDVRLNNGRSLIAICDANRTWLCDANRTWPFDANRTWLCDANRTWLCDANRTWPCDANRTWPCDANRTWLCDANRTWLCDANRTWLCVWKLHSQLYCSNNVWSRARMNLAVLPMAHADGGRPLFCVTCQVGLLLVPLWNMKQRSEKITDT